VAIGREAEVKGGDVKMPRLLFVLMGEEPASEVLKFLTESEIETISREISNVGPLHSDGGRKNSGGTLRRSVGQPIRVGRRHGLRQESHYANARRRSGPTHIDRLSQTMVTSTAFEAIERLSPIQLSQFIQNEHPQTIALILAHLKPSASPRLLESLPEESAVRRRRFEWPASRRFHKM
jgi:flagellar motor switch protein FliG